MFSYIYHTGLGALIGVMACCLLGVGYRTLPTYRQSRLSASLLVTLIAVVMVSLPYAGYRQAVANKAVSARNDRVAAIEALIKRLPFDRKCAFNGYLADPHDRNGESFPCLQRERVRVVSNPYRGNLGYFLVADDGTLARRKGFADFPIPFIPLVDRNLVDVDLLERTFTPSAPATR